MTQGLDELPDILAAISRQDITVFAGLIFPARECANTNNIYLVGYRAMALNLISAAAQIWPVDASVLLLLTFFIPWSQHR